MNILTDLSALSALSLMLLVARGFWPYVRLRGHDPVNFLMQGMFIGSTVIAMRLGWHDLVRPFLIMSDLWMLEPPSVATLRINFLLNSATGIAAWRILVGLHASLPPEERPLYSWLTAPFYPKRINIFRRGDL